MHAWPIRAAGLFLALSLLSFGFGVASADTAVRVELADFKFTPSTLTVPAGDKLNFTLVNAGERPHNLHI